MKPLPRLLVGLCLVVAVLAFLVPPAAATDYVVNTNPYSVTSTLSPSAMNLWDSYELTASSGQQVTYTMTVTTPGACAMLLFVKGHGVTTSSQYYIAYSQATCASSYTKTFPVGSSDGTDFSIMILTGSMNAVTYTLNVNVVGAGLPPIVIWIAVGALVGAVVGAAAFVMRRRTRAVATPPPPPVPGAGMPGSSPMPPAAPPTVPSPLPPPPPQTPP